MVYNEPRDWMLNPYHYLGHAYILVNKPADAIRALELDLKKNNENGWALSGICKALNMQNKKSEAQKIQRRIKAAFEKSDIKLESSVL